jgi:hypothetical protein
MIVSTPGFAEYYAVILKSIFIQPSLGYSAMFLRSGGKKINTVPFLKPFVNNFKCIRKRHYGNHSFRLFVRNIITDSTINID